MDKRGHSDEKILRVLRVAASGDKVVESCRNQRISQRRVAQLTPVERMPLRCEPHRDSQETLRICLRELAGRRVRYG